MNDTSRKIICICEPFPYFNGMLCKRKKKIKNTSAVGVFFSNVTPSMFKCYPTCEVHCISILHTADVLSSHILQLSSIIIAEPSVNWLLTLESMAFGLSVVFKKK